MKSLNWLFSLIVIGTTALSVSAQDSKLNWKGWDTAAIPLWSADSFKVSKTMNLTNAENKLLIFMFDDTVFAGRKDTVICEIGYQLGAPIINFAGLQDTAWSNNIVLDTCTSNTASKQYNGRVYGGAPAWVLDRNTETSIRAKGQIDTTIGTTTSAMFIPVIPFWAPYIRFYLHGLTGNTAHVIKSRWIFEQRAYVNVRTN